MAGTGWSLPLLTKKGLWLDGGFIGKCRSTGYLVPKTPLHTLPCFTAKLFLKRRRLRSWGEYTQAHLQAKDFRKVPFTVCKSRRANDQGIPLCFRANSINPGTQTYNLVHAARIQIYNLWTRSWTAMGYFTTNLEQPSYMGWITSVQRGNCRHLMCAYAHLKFSSWFCSFLVQYQVQPLEFFSLTHAISYWSQTDVSSNDFPKLQVWLHQNTVGT